MRRRALIFPALVLALAVLPGCGEDATWIVAVEVNGGSLFIEHPADADSLAGSVPDPGSPPIEVPEAEMPSP